MTDQKDIGPFLASVVKLTWQNSSDSECDVEQKGELISYWQRHKATITPQHGLNSETFFITYMRNIITSARATNYSG